ncbi:hypothetical protein EBU71_13450 [bacterium]|nr:hypothetical protein [Candidatus Elulimicrobium humile]
MLNETLLAGDLKFLVSSVIEIDSYKSKIGDDAKIIVISFNVESKEPADDLARFLELGYDWVVDADATDGPIDTGKYKVFVEIERNRHAPERIMDMLDAVRKLTNIENFRFRYYKSFKTNPTNIETLRNAVPLDKESYAISIKENRLNNFSNFFNRSYLENIEMLDHDITFKKMFAESLSMKIKDFGPTKEVYQRLGGNIDIGEKAISESLFLTKYLGNYNITKVGDTFVFENEGHALVLERAR